MEVRRASGSRIQWADAAKAYGIFLAYYGHFVERACDLGNPAALAQQKPVYAFHMPLFILISGFLAKTGPELSSLGRLLRRPVISRLPQLVGRPRVRGPLLPRLAS